MRRLYHPTYGLLPNMMLNLKLTPPVICQNYGLYPQVMLKLKLDGEFKPRS